MGAVPPNSSRTKTVFVASPSDVGAERNTVEKVVKKLHERWTQKIWGYELLAKRWEQLQGGDESGVQALIDPYVEGADIFVLILWSRAGTPVGGELPTEREFKEAFARFKQTGRPQILIYRRIDGPEDIRKWDHDQAKATDELVERLEKFAIVRPFQKNDFEDMFEKELTDAIQKYPLPPNFSPPQAKSYLGPFESTEGRFVEREAEFRRLEDWARKQDQPCLALTGGPGVGKTEIVRRFAAMVRERFPGGTFIADLRHGERIRENLLLWANTLDPLGAETEAFEDDRLKDLIRDAFSREPRPKLLIINDSEQSADTLDFVLGGQKAFYVLTTRSRGHAEEFAGRDNVIEVAPCPAVEASLHSLSHTQKTMNREIEAAFQTLTALFPAYPSTFSKPAAEAALGGASAALRELLANQLLETRGSGRYAFQARIRALPGGRNRAGNAADPEAALRVVRFFRDLLKSHEGNGGLLENERDNLEQAIAIARQYHLREQATDMALQFTPMLIRAGLHDSAGSILEQTLPIAQGTPEHAQVLRQLAELAKCRGRYGEAIQHGEAALRLVEAASPRSTRQEIELLTLLGWVKDRHGDSHGAESHLKAARQLAKASNDPLRKCAVDVEWGWVLAHRGRYSDAMQRWTRGIREVERAGSPKGRLLPEWEGLSANLHSCLGWVEDRLGAPEKAAHHLKQAEEVAAKLLDPEYRYCVITNRAASAIHRGEYRQARKWLEAAFPQARGDAMTNRLSILEENLGIVALRQGRDDEAGKWLEQGFKHATQTDDPERIGALFNLMGELSLNQANYPEAERCLLAGRSLCQLIENREHLSELHLNLGVLSTRLGRSAEAEEYLQTALSYGKQIGYQWILCATHNARGEAFLAYGDALRAEEEFKKAQLIALSIGSKDNQGISLLGLGAVEERRGRRSELRESGLQLLRSIGHRLSRQEPLSMAA